MAKKENEPNFEIITKKLVAIPLDCLVKIEQLGAPMKMDATAYINKIIFEHIQNSHLAFNLKKEKI